MPQMAEALISLWARNSSYANGELGCTRMLLGPRADRIRRVMAMLRRSAVEGSDTGPSDTYALKSFVEDKPLAKCKVPTAINRRVRQVFISLLGTIFGNECIVCGLGNESVRLWAKF